MKVHILKNTHPTSVDIFDPHLGYDVPLLSQGIVIAPHAVEVRASRGSPREKLEALEAFDDCLGSLHQCRPYILNPDMVAQEVVSWLQRECGAEDAYTRFNGREWKLYVDFGVRFNEHKKFLMFLNEHQINMNFLRFIESGGQVEVEPLEEVCLLAFLQREEDNI